MRRLTSLCVVGLFLSQGVARADRFADARAHFDKGASAYDLGSYDEAVTEYQASYRIKKDPALLFDIAQAQRLGGHGADAIRSYKTYLSKLPDSPMRAAVEARISELQKAQAAQEAEAQRKAEAQSVVVVPAPVVEAAPVVVAPVAAPVTIALVEAPPPLAPRSHRTGMIVGVTVGAVVVVGLALGLGLGFGLSHGAAAPTPSSLGTVRGTP